MLLASSLQSFLQLIGVLIIFVFVLLITWLTTKWLAGYQKGQTKAKNLQLVETIRVGNNKMISIVKAGKKYYVVSVGKDEVHLLGELSRDDLIDFTFEDPVVTTPRESFAHILDKFKDSLPGNQDKDE